MAHQEARQEVFQEPFTAVPNIYYDHIKPGLTDSQRAVAEVVIRKTIGWHIDSAEISNAVFMKRTGKSEPAIIRAKRALIDLGLLVVLEPGGGAATSRYAIDFHYNTHDKQQPFQNYDKPHQLHFAPTRDQSPTALEISEYHKTQKETRIDGARPVEDMSSCIKSPLDGFTDVASEHPLAFEDSSPVSDGVIRCTPEATIPELAVDVTECHSQDGLHEAEMLEASGVGDSDTPNTALAPPPDPGIYNNIYNKNKQGLDAESEMEAKESRKQACASVCSLLKSWNIELDSSSYAFVGWCLKTYGIECVQQKVQIMRFQRIRGVKFPNPLGWLRNALARNYQYSGWDTEVVKAQEKARRAIERSRNESVELRQMVANYNYEDASAKIQKIIDNLN